MSSTRKSSRPGVLHQNRFSSSRELRGDHLLGNLVVARCRTLDDPELRKLILLVQEISTLQGCEAHKTMNQFPAWPLPLPSGHNGQTGLDLLALELLKRGGMHSSEENIRLSVEWMSRLCLDPENSALDKPEQFIKISRPVALLFGIMEDASSAPLANIARTSIQSKIWDALDYTLHCKGLTLVTGDYRIGKSFSAQAWSAARMGEVRYVQLTSATSDEAFYRQICRALGVAAALTRNASELRERCEVTLQEQRLGLVVDEAAYALPQTVRTYQIPGRLTFLMGLANRNVPIALVGSSDFLTIMNSLKRKLPIWNQADFWGRVRLHTALPESLTERDLLEISKTLAPEADEATTLLLAGLAMSASGHLGTIESVVSRARFLSGSSGRTFDFHLVQQAMKDLDPSFKPIVPARPSQIVGTAPATPARKNFQPSSQKRIGYAAAVG